MKPHVLDLIPPNDLTTFLAVRNIVTALPDTVLGTRLDGKKIPIHCHVLTRALASVFPTLKVRDGFMNGLNYQHSWLVTPNNCIIDPLPIAILGGPIIIDDELLWRSFYGPEFYWFVHRHEPFVTWVTQISEVVKKIHSEVNKEK